MTLLRQIKELRSEYATIHSHVLRRVVQIHGCIPNDLDPKKSLRRTLLPEWLIIGGLPSTPSYEPDAGHEQYQQEQEDVIAQAQW